MVSLVSWGWRSAPGAALAATTPQQKCQVAKLKAQGTLQSCLARSAAGVIAGKADAAASCRTKFATALSRADAAAAKMGASCRYIDNGDGTVSDLNTGLMWEKKGNLDGLNGLDGPSVLCPGGVTCSDPHDANNLYTWCVYPCAAGPYRPDGSAFTDFLGKLNGGTSSDGSTTSGCFANHCDWRLPTIGELEGIIDLSDGCGDPFITSCIDPSGLQLLVVYFELERRQLRPCGAWRLVIGHSMI